MKQQNTTIKYFAYARKSTEGEERQALSIETQIDKIKEYFGDLVIVETLVERHSAFIPYNRPVFAKMIECIKAGEAQGIITWHPDRLSRNEIDAATVTYMIRTGQIKDLKFGSYNFDNSPEGIWMLQMALSQSQYSSAKLSKDVKRGLEKKIKMGWRPGSPPEGYINDNGPKGEKTIVKDLEKFSLVRQMWDLMLTGNYTPPKILDIANNKWGYRTLKKRKLGDKPLSRSGLYRMFTNPFYSGIMVYGGTESQGQHEPMVTLEEFDRVQYLLGRKGKPRPQKHQFSFTGSIRCEVCKCLYTAETKRKLVKKTGTIEEYTFYHCTRKRPCNQRKSITLKNMELQIEQEIEKYTILPEFKDWALEVLNSNNDHEIEDRSKIHESQAKALLATQGELDNLTKMRYRELINDDEYLKEKKPLQDQIAKLKEQLRDVEGRAEKWLELSERIFNFATYAHKEFLLTKDLNKKKEIFLGLGQNFSAKDGKLTIIPNEWFVPIKNAYPKLEKEYLRLELNKNGINKRQNESLDSLRLRWRGRRDSNP